MRATNHADRFVAIMAGGRGERFWPLSREKNSQTTAGDSWKKSFLQEAVERVLPLVPAKNIFIITNTAQAGVDGLLVLDLPPEDCMEYIVKRGSGFIYYISHEGVTGMQSKVASNLASQVAQIRAHTALPIAVGFGISNPEQAIIPCSPPHLAPIKNPCSSSRIGPNQHSCLDRKSVV